MPFLLVDSYNGNEDEVFADFDLLTTELNSRFDPDDLIRGLGGSIRVYEIVREVELEVETHIIIKDARENDDTWPNGAEIAVPYVPYNCQEGR